MKLDRVVVHGALCTLIACRIVLAAGCGAGEPEDDSGALPATMAGAAHGAAGEGVHGDEDSDEEGASGDGDSEEAMGGEHAAAEPTFGEVYGILAATCGGGQSGCHVGGMSAELALPDADAAYAALVGVASRRCDGELLVAPGDPDQSLLVTVLEGDTECVKAMPLNRDPLSAADVETIRDWIAAGALAD